MLRTSLITLNLIIASLVGSAMSGQTAANKDVPQSPWEKKLLAELPALGHRNWIVVADSAYPAQISPGIEVVVSNEDHFTVLAKVFKALDASRHVRPKIYLDKELSYLSDDLAPGIEACKSRLDAMLAGREVKPVLHEELIARLDEVAKTFRVLMIKTDLALPYTSVFMELDCGYWSPGSEQKLRRKMS
jgi:L-fucose mutarotase/ribose pyranase (RbsD/FucU family)